MFSRLFQLATSLLQVGLTPLPGSPSSPSPSSSLFSSKVGQTAESLSQEQEAHQQQVKHNNSAVLTGVIRGNVEQSLRVGFRFMIMNGTPN